MASLYAEGWRQGSILEALLPLDSVVLESGRPSRRQSEHGLWAVATQDCDLEQTDAHMAEPTIELRPVYVHDAPVDWGLRSARLRLTDREYASATSPRTTIAADTLTELLGQGAGRRALTDSRARAFTTWLGLRYDRPAVPVELLSLAKRIAEEVARLRNGDPARRIRDVLMQFDESQTPVHFSLFAVLEREEDEEATREWLAAVARAIPQELGIADEIEARTAARISLELVESSYAADITQLTWRRRQPEPDGAA